MSTEAQRCQENIDRCLEHVMTGRAPEGWINPVQYAGTIVASFEGALQGWVDWTAEKEMCEAEEK